MGSLKYCPIEITLKYIGKKWSIGIIRDLFYGAKRFSDFLHENTNLSTRVLSVRLKELEQDGLVQRKVGETIRYCLTKKGKDLQKILYELSMFSVRNYPDDVLKKPLQSYTKVDREIKKELLMFNTRS